MYYLGSLFAYATMKGPRNKKRKPRPDPTQIAADNPLATEEEKKRAVEWAESKKKRKKKKANMKLFIVFLVGSMLMLGITLSLHYMFQWGRDSKKYGHFAHVMFITFGKIIFVLSFMAILLPISFTYKGFGNFIATSKLLQLIGNISFPGYLYHFTVIMMRMHSTEALPTYTFYDFLGAFTGDFFYTIILATIGSIFIELPLQGMWRTRCENVIMARLKAWVQGSKNGAPRSRSSSKASQQRIQKRQINKILEKNGIQNSEQDDSMNQKPEISIENEKVKEESLEIGEAGAGN